MSLHRCSTEHDKNLHTTLYEKGKSQLQIILAKKQLGMHQTVIKRKVDFFNVDFDQFLFNMRRKLNLILRNSNRSI